jgi:hypothetical protein
VYALDHYGENPLTMLLMALSASTAPYTGMIVFSDADTYGNGIKVAAAIKEAFTDKGLVSASNINPNSGNAITTWIWAPNWKEVAEWMDKQGSDKKRAYSKERVAKIKYAYRDRPDSDECDCEDCRRERGEWRSDAD